MVEDEPKMDELVRKGLEHERFSVLTAHTGTDGLELALSSSFDAIVLDVMLPALSGFEVAKRMRDAGNNTPILFLTARDSRLDVVE